MGIKSLEASKNIKKRKYFNKMNLNRKIQVSDNF